jgi:predicted alpha/beta hydrolase family esterase
MQQILHIHGGETYKSYEMYFEYLKKYPFDLEKFENKKKDWVKHLQKDLGNNYQVIRPIMPSPRNAKYAEWKIWLEKFFPYLEDEIILTRKSLGGTFWAKYLSENKFPVKISQLHLVATPFDNNDPLSWKKEKYDLIDFSLGDDLSLIAEQVDKIFIHHSQDDDVVDFEMSKKFAEVLPSAKKLNYTDRGHFSIENFPEILEIITKH